MNEILGPPLRVALLSRWHVHAEDYAREAQQLDGIEVACVWDEDAERGRTWAAELGVPFASNLERLLADETIHAVIVTTPTRDHREVLIAAAEAGKHIFSEKVLAATTADADAIFAAVDASRVKLMLSLPRLTESLCLAAQDALDRGDLGRLTSLRCRVAHDGAVPSAGGSGWLPARFFEADAAIGGALIDLGAHPIYLCNRLGGEPDDVTALFGHTTGHEVDDTAAALVRYEQGALGIIETGFANRGCPPLLELHGTEGTFFGEGERIRIRTGDEPWRERVGPAPLPSPMQQWLADIRGETSPSITRQDMRDLTRVNEAAAASVAEGQTTSVRP